MRLINFILGQKKYKWLLLLIWTALATGILLKILFWPTLRIDFLIFFGLAVPFVVLIINLLPYSYYANWITLCEKFSDGYKINEDLKVHIKNFDPWKDLSKKQNRFQFNRPFYDFEKADILESEDLIIVYGQNDSLFSYYKNTRPFGLCIGDKKLNEPDLYLVSMISMSRTKEYCEIVFTDHNYSNSGQIKMIIYNRPENVH
jgi:hypothetical protein